VNTGGTGWLGSTIDGTLGDAAQAWLALAIAVVLLASAGEGPARIVRYTLSTVILYVLLVNAGRLRPFLENFNAALGWTAPAAAGGGGTPKRK
jgi:hypothetical protein